MPAIKSVDLDVERLSRGDQDEWVLVFAGLSVRQFRRLVQIVAGCGGEQTGTGRRWSLPLADRVLLIAVYYRTNLTLRQVAPLFGISKSAAHRVVDHLAPLLALAPATRPHGPDTVLIVDGTLVDLGRPAEVEQYARKSLDMDPGYRRGKTFNISILAMSLAAQGQLEEACEQGKVAVDMAAGRAHLRAGVPLPARCAGGSGSGGC